jgi:thiol-disulfide isomerase/thioredoxin
MKLFQQLLLVFVLIILSITILYGQSTNNIRPLDIGDTIPSIEINNVINYTKDKLRPNDFKDKALILDFWGPSCMSCLESFPHLDSLQQYFRSNLQIVLVNKQSPDSTFRFFQKRKKIKQPAIPFATQDSILDKYFPHIGDPFLVWIDKYGVIRHITDGMYETTDNVEKFLKDSTIELPRARDNIYVETLFDDKWKDLIETFSYISKCRSYLWYSGISGKEFKQEITYSCSSIIQLYEAAIDGMTNNKFQFYRPGRILVETRDSARFFPPRNEGQLLQWAESYSYNYQLLVPLADSIKRFIKMKNDLDEYFHIMTSIEKRKIKCLLLIRTSKQDKLASKGGLSEDNFLHNGLRSTKADSIRYMKNKPFRRFSSYLQSFLENDLNLPFVNLTGYKGNIDIEINDTVFDPINLNNLKKELNKYNLDIIKKEYLIDVLVLKDNKYQK